MELLAGKIFGRLTVLSLAPSASDGKSVWFVRCECGTQKAVRAANLKSGSTTSCGCLRDQMLADRSRTHGMSKTPIYASWKAMVERCTDPEHPCYAAYGGRGITVCRRWLRFENFAEDMGPTHFPGASIDREEADMGYTPSNCRWLDLQENRKRKRNVLYVSYRGRRRSLRELAESRGLDFSKVYYRFRRGYSVDECLSSGDFR